MVLSAGGLGLLLVVLGVYYGWLWLSVERHMHWLLVLVVVGLLSRWFCLLSVEYFGCWWRFLVLVYGLGVVGFGCCWLFRMSVGFFFFLLCWWRFWLLSGIGFDLLLILVCGLVVGCLVLVLLVCWWFWLFSVGILVNC